VAAEYSCQYWNDVVEARGLCVTGKHYQQVNPVEVSLRDYHTSPFSLGRVLILITNVYVRLGGFFFQRRNCPGFIHPSCIIIPRVHIDMCGAEGLNSDEKRS